MEAAVGGTLLKKWELRRHGSALPAPAASARRALVSLSGWYGALLLTFLMQRSGCEATQKTALWRGRGFAPTEQRSAPPKNGPGMPGVSQAHVPSHIGPATQQLPSCHCRSRSRPRCHHQGRAGRQSQISGRRSRRGALECAPTAPPCAPLARTGGRSLRERWPSPRCGSLNTNPRW
jgi:hypothetical protein